MRMLIAFSMLVVCIGSSPAQDDADAQPQTEAGAEQTTPSAEVDPSLEQRLANYLNRSKFVGRFTVDGSEGDRLKEETYTISKCEKLPAKEMYRLTAKIAYGETDVEVPLQLRIVFADKTPVITIDSLHIPGMGTFSSRVMIHQDRYSGTWQHDDRGGHLFGRIEQMKD